MKINKLMLSGLFMILAGAMSIAHAVVDPTPTVETITLKQNSQAVVPNSDANRHVAVIMDGKETTTHQGCAQSSLLPFDSMGNLIVNDTQTEKKISTNEVIAAATRCCRIVMHGGIPVKKCQPKPPSGCPAGWFEE